MKTSGQRGAGVERRTTRCGMDGVKLFTPASKDRHDALNFINMLIVFVTIAE